MLQRLESKAFSAILIGDESLSIGCGDLLVDAGCTIAAVISDDDAVRRWAEGKGIAVDRLTPGLEDRLADVPVDWLFSIANLQIIPQQVLQLATSGAINFHDGPLPRYAGVNAPVWAILNGETEFGVTWHLIEEGIDEGRIVMQHPVAIDPDETAFSLNAKCYAAGLDSFAHLLTAIGSGTLDPVAQDLSRRSYFGRDMRPEAAGMIDFTKSVKDILTLCRALDHGTYWNPLCRAKIVLADRIALIEQAEKAEAPLTGEPGTVISVDKQDLCVAAADGALTFRVSDPSGGRLDLTAFVQPGQVLRSPDRDKAGDLSRSLLAAARGERYWRQRLLAFRALELPVLPSASEESGAILRSVRLPGAVRKNSALAAIAAWALQCTGRDTGDLALRIPETAALAERARPNFSDWLPLRIGNATPTEGELLLSELEQSISDQLAAAAKRPVIQTDLAARDPAIESVLLPDFGLNLCDSTLLPGTALTVAPKDDQIVLVGNAERIDQGYFHILADRLEHVISAVATANMATTTVKDLPILPVAERKLLTQGLNRTERDFAREECLHQAFEAQAAAHPDGIALVFENSEISYTDLNARANRLAHVLQEMGVGPGTRVGIHLDRAPEMVIAAIATMKAGSAFVPLDPTYPADRTAHCVSDSGMSVIVTQEALEETLPDGAAQVLVLDRDPRIGAADAENPESGVSAEDIAYVIYTSGSTGLPKGVRVRHRNVANFMAGMDDRIGPVKDGVWLALTSLSFDISVLELFYTLSRGYKVILSSDADRALVADAPIIGSDRKIDFSLFYWGNDDGAGPKKYELLLEGAKFADTHGFCAVWTPERHFHAFGGPYPNPSVSGAAVAAVTKNLSVRSGSVVAPLHHPARIAEDWAMIDNLTNGRAALGIASGWQPHDFVLRPENAPPNNKAAMYDTIDKVRRLWRGEKVAFPMADGKLHEIVTQPRPVSRELPIWLTIAGNPDTWREAGEIGANVLTHLLGQSKDEVAEKIEIYHDALRKADHDPADFKVTLMLHTFVGHDREIVREIARGPMKEYLASAATLIKQFAWVFPAFKRPKGVDNAFELDLGTLEPDELDAILDFAFERYFEESGFFGTKADCLARVEELKRIGVDEVACLIDYGIATGQVMQGLYELADVLAEANLGTQIADDDFSIAAQIHRHGVTHLQCTPSMARMLVTNDAARAALTGIETLMIGGEPLPNALARDLRAATKARLLNMYGPTETTIWSTVAEIDDVEAPVSIGTPIANTRTYILDPDGDLVPFGLTGELYIGGEGVAAGYWQRDELTQTRFLPDPFTDASPNGAMYRTGDLARWRTDGQLECLGRIDGQIKLRGHRIELGEIEFGLARLPGVTEAVVVPHAAAVQDVRLVAYVTGSANLVEAELRELLAKSLPAHMIPWKIVQVDAFPLTPNRKVDRNALAARRPALQDERMDGPASISNETEKAIAAIWSRVLGVTRIEPRDNFFALGGHSLLAVQVHRDICGEMGPKTVSITDIFAHPTLRGLATRIDGRRVADRPAATAVEPQQKAPASVVADRRALRASREIPAE